MQAGQPSERPRRSVLSIAPGCALALAIAVLLVRASAPPVAAQSPGPDFFPQTGYGIANRAFLDFFARRGGVTTFGYPVSNEFLLLGTRVQVFQRQVLQQRPDGSVGTLNLLADDLFPVTRLNGSTFPANAPDLAAAVPLPGSEGYFERALRFVETAAPDRWNGLDLRFGETFRATVTCADAFPGEPCDEGLLPGLALEVWGLPTSRPVFDPANTSFIYQRFQRGILHHDRSTGLTQGLLLADWFKQVLLGANLPPDLEAQMARSRFYAQYDPRAPGALARPEELPGTSLEGAFNPDDAGVVAALELLAARAGPQAAARRSGDDPAPAGTMDEPGGSASPDAGSGAGSAELPAAEEPAGPGTPTRTPRPTRTPTATREPTATRTPTSTRTPRPTATPEPTATPRPTRTPTPSRKPTPTPTPLPTLPPPVFAEKDWVDGFTYKDFDPPSGPPEGPGPGGLCGDRLSINGRYFGEDQAAVEGTVVFGGVRAWVVYRWSDTQVQVQLPWTAAPVSDGRTYRLVLTTRFGAAETTYTVRAPC